MPSFRVHYRFQAPAQFPKKNISNTTLHQPDFGCSSYASSSYAAIGLEMWRSPANIEVPGAARSMVSCWPQFFWRGIQLPNAKSLTIIWLSYCHQPPKFLQIEKLPPSSHPRAMLQHSRNLGRPSRRRSTARRTPRGGGSTHQTWRVQPHLVANQNSGAHASRFLDFLSINIK